MSATVPTWGLIPHGCKEPTGGRKPINARAESVASLPTFRAAYAKRRCIVPVESFFEWRAIKGTRAKQPYAVAMKDRTALRHRWSLGELAPSAKRGMDSHVCHHHRARECSRRANSRPYAAHPAQIGLRSVARAGTRPARSAHVLCSGPPGDVAGLDAGEQSRQRRFLTARSSA